MDPQPRPSAKLRRSSHGSETVAVPQNVYLKYIKSQVEDESACLELPLTIMLLVTFSVLAILHCRQSLVFMVEQGIELDIRENANFAFSHAFGHKSIVDAHSFADFWSWVRLGFIPLVVQPSWAYSERYQEDARRVFGYTPQPLQQHSYGNGEFKKIPHRGDYLHYHRIVGGLRFRQETARISEDLCIFPGKAEREAWLQWYGKPCMPATSEVVFTPDSTNVEGFGVPERVEWMFTDLDSLETMIGQVIDMEDGCSQLTAKNRTQCLCRWCREQDPPSPWLTENTQRIEISMATYNAEYGLISLTSINFFFNRGGYVHKHVEVKSSWMDTLSMPLWDLVPMLTCDFIWLVSLVSIIVSELRELVHVIRDGEGKWYESLRKDYIEFWNIVDWVSILVAIIVVVFFARLVSHTLEMHRALLALIQAQVGGDDREAYSTCVMDFYQALETACLSEWSFRMCLCAYPYMVMLRLFKSFAAQPRLAMVTETLKEAYQDMVHFSLVFAGAFVCLCLNAVLLFGQHLEDFATFPRALHSCFRMMFGDWDWQPMEEVWRLTAMVWFWLFMLLLVVILLNMLVAIVNSNYMNVKKRSANATTLGGQIQSMWRRYKQNKRKERVRLGEILSWFLRDAGGSEQEMMTNPRYITPSFLRNHIRGIPQDQAIRTLTNAEDEHRKETEDEFKLENALAPLERINANTKLSRDGLYYTFDRVDFYDTGPDPEQQPEEEAEVAPETEPPEQEVSTGVLKFIQLEVQRLSMEMAGVLADGAKRVDQHQTVIEQRQEEMAAFIHEMHTALLNLQSEACSLANQLQRINYDQAKEQRQVSAWRRTLQGCQVVPNCFDLAVGEANEALLPRVQGSRFGLSLPTD